LSLVIPTTETACELDEKHTAGHYGQKAPYLREHRKLDDAAKSIEDSFGSTTIADMINVPRRRSKPLCSFPLEK